MGYYFESDRILNNTNFGLALAVNLSANGLFNTVTAYVDYVQITVTYTINGVVSWYTASSGGSSIGTGTPFNPVGVAGSGLPNTNTPGTTTFYAECSTNTWCRAATDFVINSRPTAAITSSDIAICDGESTNISGTITASGAWTLILDNSGGTVTGSGSGTWSKSVSPTTSTTYAISSLVDAQCTSIPADLTGSEQVTVNTRPVAAITSSNTGICNGGSTNISGTITASGAWTLTLDNSGGSATGTGSGTWSISVSPTTTTTYSISSLVDAQCNSIAADLTGSEEVNINTLPVTSTNESASPATICSGSSSTISATVGSGGDEVKWYTASCGGTLVGTGDQLVSPTSTTTYYARSYNSTTGCYSAACVNVTVTVIAAGTWLGVTDSDWNTASNWCGGVPIATTNVVIPSGVTNMPHVTSALNSPAVCYNLTIENGDSLTVDAGKALTVNGSLVVNGPNALIVKSSSSAIGSLITMGSITYLNSGSIKVEKYVKVVQLGIGNILPHR